MVRVSNVPELGIGFVRGRQSIPRMGRTTRSFQRKILGAKNETGSHPLVSQKLEIIDYRDKAPGLSYYVKNNEIFPFYKSFSAILKWKW
jgi:hypothetical protein